MQINVIDVGTPNTHSAKNGRTYQSLEVTYKGADGRVANKKLMSFSNPDVFKSASSWTKGDAVEIVSEKDANGYWQWIGIGEPGAPSQKPQTNTPTSGGSTQGARVTGSNYETKEERAARQELIVRQSSLSNAVAILSVGAKSLAATDVLSLADELAFWVFNKPEALEKSNSIGEIEDDIPY